MSQNFATQLHRNPWHETSFIWLNVRSAPFDNLLARQAFNYAVDRSAIAQLGQGAGPAHPTCQLLPPEFPGYVAYCPYTENPTQSGAWVAPNVLKAQALVRQSGTLGDQVTLMEPIWPGMRPWPGYQALVATLRTIGYRARLAPVTGPTLLRAPSRFFERFQAGVNDWTSDYVSAAQFLATILECSDIAQGTNSGHFCDPSLDAKIATAQTQQPLHPGLASQLWTAIDRKLADQAALVPLFNAIVTDMVARRVGNYQYNPQWDMFVDQMWVR